MKEIRLVRFTVLLAAMSLSAIIFAQNDTETVSITKAKTVEDSSDYYYRQKYKYLNMNLMEEFSAFKFSMKFLLFNSRGYTNFWSAGYSVSYEKKLYPAFSLTGECRNYNTPDSSQITGFGLQLKYFFLKKQEIRNETGANNSYGFHLLFGVQNIYAYRPNLWDNHKINKEFVSIPEMQFGIGYQFHIFEYLSFNFNCYENYTLETNKFDFRIEGNINLVLSGKKNN